MKLIDRDQQKSISELLSELVPKKGKSKAAVGKALSVSGQLLGQYMAGKKAPKAPFYQKWKSVYGEDLMMMIEPNVSRETNSEAQLPGDLKVTLQDHYNMILENNAYLKKIIDAGIVATHANFDDLKEILLRIETRLDLPPGKLVGDIPKD